MFRKILHNEIITISLFSKALKTGDLKFTNIFCPHWHITAIITSIANIQRHLAARRALWQENISPLHSIVKSLWAFSLFCKCYLVAILWPMNLVKSLTSCYFHFAQLWDDSPREDGEVLEKFSFGLTFGSNHLEATSLTRIVNHKTQNVWLNGWRCGGRRSKSHYQRSEYFPIQPQFKWMFFFIRFITFFHDSDPFIFFRYELKVHLRRNN